MKLVLVESMDQVLAAALRRKPRPLQGLARPGRLAQDDGAAAAVPPARHARPPLFPPQQPPAVA